MASQFFRSLRKPTFIVRPMPLTTSFQASMSSSGFKPIVVPSKQSVQVYRNEFLTRRFFATENDEDEDADIIENEDEDAVVGQNDWCGDVLLCITTDDQSNFLARIRHEGSNF